jgi:hypothetical protein
LTPLELMGAIQSAPVEGLENIALMDAEEKGKSSGW